MSNFRDIIFRDKSTTLKALVFLLVFFYFGIRIYKSILTDVNTYNKNVTRTNKNYYVFSRVIEISVRENNKVIKTILLPVSSVVKIIIFNDIYKNNDRIIDLTVLSPRKKY